MMENRKICAEQWRIRRKDVEKETECMGGMRENKKAVRGDSDMETNVRYAAGEMENKNMCRWEDGEQEHVQMERWRTRNAQMGGWRTRICAGGRT
jgi:hypothetical protein